MPTKGYYLPTTKWGLREELKPWMFVFSKKVFQEVLGPGENISELGHWQEAYLAIMI